ncbi:MAG TPA: L-seryl-tRNA(Sec) selenium transferase [Kofleriaceae bacterium]|nr:L-seryl-tRNA(Sec) selenium transferase [Kofleriaceae bacterium]
MPQTPEYWKLPKVDQLLDDPGCRSWIAAHGRDLVVGAVRAAISAARATIARGEPCPRGDAILAEVEQRLLDEGKPSLRPVINASGVIIHTNLGRSPLSDDTVAAMTRVARGYSNLELDLGTGERGSRYEHCGRLLAALTGAEDGIAVNNNASSLLLILRTLAAGREVIVSRGQLIEIGEGVRIPEVMEEAGVKLVEVGTTNRTYTRDFERAITERTAALMVVHRSNFRISGYTFDPPIEELAALARSRGIVLVDDVGSGTLLDTAPYGLGHEPMVQERVAAGADVVCFSGDKLLGGPQAGYIVGKKPLIDRMKKSALLRALRIDKTTLAGIEATLRHYRRGDALERIPIWRAIAAPVGDAEHRAHAWKDRLGPVGPRVQVIETSSPVGGGALPGLTLPTRALAIGVPDPNELARALRLGDPPVVPRVEQDQVVFDPRTVFADDDDAMLDAMRPHLQVAHRHRGRTASSAARAGTDDGSTYLLIDEGGAHRDVPFELLEERIRALEDDPLVIGYDIHAGFNVPDLETLAALLHRAPMRIRVEPRIIDERETSGKNPFSPTQVYAEIGGRTRRRRIASERDQLQYVSQLPVDTNQVEAAFAELHSGLFRDRIQPVLEMVRAIAPATLGDYLLQLHQVVVRCQLAAPNVEVGAMSFDRCDPVTGVVQHGVEVHRRHRIVYIGLSKEGIEPGFTDHLLDVWRESQTAGCAVSLIATPLQPRPYFRT